MVEKNEKGITLIALIITIIVLLILAGVSIAMLTGENGILNRAEETEYIQAHAELVEEMSLSITESIMEILATADHNHNIAEVLKIAKKNGYIDDINHIIIVLGTNGIEEQTEMSIDEVSSSCTKVKIIDEKTGAYVILTMLENGSIVIGDEEQGTGSGSTSDDDADDQEDFIPEKDESESTKKLANNVSVGDYIAYDAGEWTQADFDSISASSGNPTVNATTNLPTTQGQFGGFTIGQSRNSNCTSYLYTTYGVPTPEEGWRVWSIDGDIVTIVHAGYSEAYYHYSDSSEESTTILRERNTKMYENEYAESSRIMTGQDAANWYKTQYDANVLIEDNGGSVISTFYGVTVKTEGVIDVLENGSYYWLATPFDSTYVYYMDPHNRRVNRNCRFALGIRVLVSLRADAETSGINENGVYELIPN